MQVQIDLIDQQYTACIEWVAMITENFADAIHQVTAPSGNVLIAVT